MGYKGKGIDDNKVQQYATQRIEMGKKFSEKIFGRAEIHFLDANDGLIKIKPVISGKGFLPPLSMELDVGVAESY